PGVERVEVETAWQMLAACRDALPADVAVCTAAVADWHVTPTPTKIKKTPGGTPPTLILADNPDILAELSQPSARRPTLVVGFAAETNDVIAHATAKRARKGCDWIVANDVRAETGIMGGQDNEVTLITPDGAETWPRQPKTQVAAGLAARIADMLAGCSPLSPRTPEPR
ncbi:phosphopantothenoylcysteine decarboxylase domain-containing protein, partial [Ameyamaea chiangmaiensis]